MAHVILWWIENTHSRRRRAFSAAELAAECDEWPLEVAFRLLCRFCTFIGLCGGTWNPTSHIAICVVEGVVGSDGQFPPAPHFRRSPRPKNPWPRRGLPQITQSHRISRVPDVAARVYHYSADGRLYAYALPTGVRIFQAEGAQLLLDLPIPNVVDIKFSPRGTYLSTWERPVKLEDGSQHKNLRVFSSSTGEELVAFTQKSQDGWDLQYTVSESHAIRLVGAEIQVFRPSEWSKGVVDKLKVEGATSVSLSPGPQPLCCGVYCREKGPTSKHQKSTKTFFKADRAQIKWNDLGTQVLLLTQTEVDNSNKSYYGETGMYLLSAAGNFDCRVTLDKEGPIHDFAWSPTSKEFGVVYGFMPAKTMLFDQRVRTIYDFGSSPHNFISFNPQGRLIALAGFGNLAGKMDIFDRRSLSKVCSIDAPNTSYCDWSPDGRFLMTATLSPRLRVDNGIKIFHCSGPLMHVQLVEELYQASWRPTPTLPVAPAPSASVQAHAAIAKPVPTRPAGAYRPPGARGPRDAGDIQREDEGGAARVPSNGTATPPRPYSRSPAPPGAHSPPNGHAGGYGAQNGGGRRHVPGAAAHTPSPGPEGGERKSNRKRKGKKEGGAGGGEEGQGQEGGAGQGREQGTGKRKPKGERGAPNGEQGEASRRGSVDVAPATTPNGNGNGTTLYIPPPDLQVDGEALLTSGVDGALDPAAKKARNLNKKLKAIEELKEKANAENGWKRRS
ncbi:eukaryotic translation initiation factor 2A [Favolaschia claudopus]|uniref:Eukaryotic translation initiation factor 2A n=1 Tax=Favolaschia claudopus TaxID=2862362 RepID=A0AAW0BE51_9AGAR